MRYFTVLIVALLFFSTTLNAQTSRGYRVGFGIPVKKNFIVGLQDNFRHKKQGSDKLSSFSNTAGLFARYNMKIRRLAVFPQVSAGAGVVSKTNHVLDWGTGQTISKRSNKITAEYLAGVGATYYLYPGIGVETLFDFDIQKKRPSLDLGLQFFIR